MAAGNERIRNEGEIIFDFERIHKPTKRELGFRWEKNIWILDAAVAAKSVFGGFSRPE